ncbi:MAG: AEC family transporter [Faecalibacterium sp.]|nr:AEC family transporter [Faecalibacterium sp.]
MDQFFKMAEIQSVLFLYMLVGYAAGKLGMFKEPARRGFNDLLLYVAMPCMIFQSFDREFTADTLRQGALIICVASGISAVAWAFGKVAYNWCPPGERSIMQYGTLFSNAGFAGLPVIQDAYGAPGLFLASLFLIPNRILMWSVGVNLFTGQKAAGKAARRKAIKSVLTNPGILAVEAGFVRMLLQPALPAPLTKAMDTLGSICTPLSMIVIGLILSAVDLRTVLDKKVFVLMGVRQFLFPLSALFVLRALGLDPLTVQVAVVLNGMPVGSSTALLADQYGADSAFASKCVMLSTLTSLVTIPILTLFF